MSSILGLITQAKTYFLAHKIIAVIITILLCAGGYWGYNTLFKTTPPQYQTASVEKGTLVSSISASGTISGGNNVTITTDASGVITAVYVKNGDSVIQGEKLADIQLDQSSQVKQAQAWNSYLQAKSALDSAQAKINSLQATAFQANQKFINDAVARGLKTDDPTYIQENATWKQAEADYQNQLGSIAATQAGLTSAWLSYQLISPTITAPTSGIINNLTLVEGLPISASSGSNSTATNQSYGTIVLQQGQLQATVNLSEVDVVHVLPGQKATVTLDAFPDKTFTGRILTVNTNGTTNSGVTTYPTTLSLDTTENRIYPNMAMNAKIITSVKDNVLLVPNQAVQTINGQKTIRVLHNNQITVVPVDTGESNDTQTVITSGVHEGDIVVIGTISTGTTPTGTSPFGGLGGNRGFGGGGGGTIIRRGG